MFVCLTACSHLLLNDIPEYEYIKLYFSFIIWWINGLDFKKRKTDVEKWKAEKNERIGLTLGGTMFSHGEGASLSPKCADGENTYKQEMVCRPL